GAQGLARGGLSRVGGGQQREGERRGMSGLWQHFLGSLRLHFRNRLALVYGHVFPLIFLAVFFLLYRHERVPLLRHLGELLTVTVLGGACFGLPTTLVGERERGVW